MKQRVAVLFGGKSTEHEVSIVSARSVVSALDSRKYEPVPLALDKENQWLDIASSKEYLQTGVFRDSFQYLNAPIKSVADIFFPLVHGSFGEDGSLQGFLDLKGVPYVGSGVLGSAIGMDKEIQKYLLHHHGIPVTDFKVINDCDWMENRLQIVNELEKTYGFPVFVKPANAGSSVGISKSKDRQKFLLDVENALQYDNKVLVEKVIHYARELECAILGNEEPQASVLGEVVPSNEFYDYDAKYVDGASQIIIPAKLPPEIITDLRQTALKVFKITQGFGMMRVDFLLNQKNLQWVVNEVNTIPGFTSISMYPKMWEATGLPYKKLLSKLIKLAEERFEERKKIKYSYQPRKTWYQ